ncbi:hypothetical protein SJI19_15725 [Acerihabitans sp. TG2]|uniref:hypothetical protein n=1 Tax=Acerihabitans sp. TG2 TaxID=3096008 RepID=UPI002B224ACE|nr:hypothetical protein [Acerihabitans sp. TG2]MEA9391976.1 hypothetical protein [Acerihabitans sp. TG2]
MVTNKPEEAMTFGELLDVISEQQRRLSVLEVAFSYLSFSLDEKATQLLIHNLSLEAKNQTRDASTQACFAQLANDMAQRMNADTSPIAQQDD